MSQVYGWPVQPSTRSPEAARAAHAKVSLAKREDLLTQIPMFSALKKRQIHSLARITETAEFPAGYDIVTEGEDGNFCGIIVDGSVEVIRGGSTIARLESGEFFGEMALIDPAPRSATVRTVNEVTAIRIHEQAFTEVVSKDPGIAMALMTSLAQRLRETMRLAENGS